MANLVPCPYCQGTTQTVGFTWWGGLIGPRILSHCKCTRCGKTYNGKTGKSNDTAVIIYICVSVGLAVVILGCMGIAGVMNAASR